jgi:hypothetical protein
MMGGRKVGVVTAVVGVVGARTHCLTQYMSRRQAVRAHLRAAAPDSTRIPSRPAFCRPWSPSRAPGPGCVSSRISAPTRFASPLAVTARAGRRWQNPGLGWRGGLGCKQLESSGPGRGRPSFWSAAGMVQVASGPSSAVRVSRPAALRLAPAPGKRVHPPLAGRQPPVTAGVLRRIRRRKTQPTARGGEMSEWLR